MKQLLILIILLSMFTACNNNDYTYDASGTFETTEIIISSEANGKIQLLKLQEGDYLNNGQYLGYIDTTQLYLTKNQLLATKRSIKAKQPNVDIQIASIKEQISNAKYEKNRIENLQKDNAATQKQLDDVDSQIKVLERTLSAQLNTLNISVNSIDTEMETVDAQIALINDQLVKCKITNPVNGTVLTKYAEENEMVTAGKPLYKIADTKNIFLRVYIISTQLDAIKLGTEANITVNNSHENNKNYQGKVVWISDKAEFTPKTIQTKDERQNLVYAVKIAVENTDGLLKIGMYGDVNFVK